MKHFIDRSKSYRNFLGEDPPVKAGLFIIDRVTNFSRLQMGELSDC
jgi:hypothetical protein